MKTIWKFPLPPEAWEPSGAKVLIPLHGRIRHVHSQDRGPDMVADICLWVEVDPTASKHDRKFWIVPTGGEIPRDGEYVGTAHVSWTVWHVYEEVLF